MTGIVADTCRNCKMQQNFQNQLFLLQSLSFNFLEFGFDLTWEKFSSPWTQNLAIKVLDFHFTLLWQGFLLEHDSKL